MNPEQIYEKFYKNSKLELHIFFSLINHDPTRFEKNGETVKLGKYGKWIITIYANCFFEKDITEEDFIYKKSLVIEDLEKLEYYLNLYNKHKKKLDIELRDIFKFKKLSELYIIIKRFDIKDENNSLNIFDLVEENTDYKYLGEFNGYNTYVPLNSKGASILGVDTEWCTSYGKYSLNKKHKSKGNMFENYKQDNLYILISNKNNKIKYQLYFKTLMFMDINDKTIKDVNRFYKLICYLIENDYKIPEINRLTLNKNYIEIYVKSINKRLNEITNIIDYVSFYKKFYNNLDINLIESNNFKEITKNLNVNGYLDLIHENLSSISFNILLIKQIPNFDDLNKMNLFLILVKSNDLVKYTLIKKLNLFGIEIKDIFNQVQLNSIYDKYKGFRGNKI